MTSVVTSNGDFKILHSRLITFCCKIPDMELQYPDMELQDEVFFWDYRDDPFPANCYVNEKNILTKGRLQTETKHERVLFDGVLDIYHIDKHLHIIHYRARFLQGYMMACAKVDNQ